MKSLPYILGAVVLVIAGVFLWQKYFQGEPVIQAPPTAGTVPVATAPHITHGNALLPAPDEHTTGVVQVTVPPDTVAGVAIGKPREIFFYLTDNPGKPPMVRSETPIQAVFAPVVDPWLVFEAKVMVGGSCSSDGYVSPNLALTGVRLFRLFNAGISLDRTGAGPFASWEVFREFNVGLVWYLLPIRDTHARAGIMISYRF